MISESGKGETGSVSCKISSGTPISSGANGPSKSNSSSELSILGCAGTVGLFNSTISISPLPLLLPFPPVNSSSSLSDILTSLSCSSLPENKLSVSGPNGSLGSGLLKTSSFIFGGGLSVF